MAKRNTALAQFIDEQLEELRQKRAGARELVQRAKADVKSAKASYKEAQRALKCADKKVEQLRRLHASEEAIEQATRGARQVQHREQQLRERVQDAEWRLAQATSERDEILKEAKAERRQLLALREEDAMA